jgi:lysophospholipid acyltransferase (LPLAT)-like uncharacterized protein
MAAFRKHQLKQRAWLMKPLGWSLAAALRLWLSTLRTREQLEDESLDPRRGATGNIYCIWHEAILVQAHHFRDCGMQVLISRSTDGELVTRTVERLGFEVVRGSTGRGGLTAVRELLKGCRAPNLVLTPDGPRGPRRHFQLGAVYLASRLQMPLVAAGCGVSRAWRLNSWDQLLVPQPFSPATICASRALPVPPDADAATLEHYRQRIEAEMHRVTARAEELTRSPSSRAAESSREFRKSA